MRGKETPARAAGWTERITPAYAGKSKKLQFYRIRQRDHPRLCGEKAFLKTADTLKWGSPPPMRGKAAIAGLVAAFVGITPAYAGKSCYSAAYAGEKSGSPPPMRGKETTVIDFCNVVGITPAYAGKR